MAQWSQLHERTRRNPSSFQKKNNRTDTEESDRNFKQKNLQRKKKFSEHFELD